MPLPANPGALTIAQLCSALQSSTMGEAAALVAELRNLFQLPLAVVLQGYGAEAGVATDGSSFPGGSPITIVGGVDAAGNAQQMLTDTGGRVSVLSGFSDAGVTDPRAFLTDRSNILCVAPPVSKLWRLSDVPASATALGAQSIAAPGAGLRNVVLAWGISVAMGANALAASSLFSVRSGGVTSAAVALACPANDCRIFSAVGPILGTVNSNVDVVSPAIPVGGFVAGWAVGYVASYP